MRSKMLLAAAFAASLTAGGAMAQTAPAQTAPEWRTVAPENLLVIDTAKGRIIVELDPAIAPRHVERIRTLADSGFYDGLKFHRVIPGFMAQTGDPQGTGQGGSDMPDVPSEFQFRRGRDAGFAMVQSTGSAQFGLVGSMPVVTQPDAQMFVTADMKAAGQALFCSGVVGMARNGSDVNSANSQFFLMMETNENLNGGYTPFGRVLSGMDVITALNAGTDANNGAVENPDIMTRTRTAAALPEGERPAARVMDPRNPAFAAVVAEAKTRRGAAFTICDVQPPVQITGG
ncbi:MAG TPA: peptidylprolyl isomerase [Brevundimonas sp.]